MKRLFACITVLALFFLAGCSSIRSQQLPRKLLQPDQLPNQFTIRQARKRTSVVLPPKEMRAQYTSSTARAWGLLRVCPQPKREVTVDPRVTGQQLAEDLLAYFYAQQIDNPCGARVFAYHNQGEADGAYTAGEILVECYQFKRCEQHRPERKQPKAPAHSRCWLRRTQIRSSSSRTDCDYQASQSIHCNEARSIRMLDLIAKRESLDSIPYFSHATPVYQS